MKTISLGLDQLLGQKQLKKPAPNLGERELEVMKILWGHESLSAREVLDLCEENSLSLSTMQSTLERLHRKELISRQKQGRHYLYRAIVSRSTIIGQLLGDIADQFGEGDIAPMISGFVSYVDQESARQNKSLLPDLVLKSLQAAEEGND
ncbi:BlaI/MecI/CopY family transcriptional regulator [Pseudoteredinibacter isoporae]|uniref:Putative transcriptional regulator n=1 Tax=Pseudoteredinibacter isoporae TaxID=570281 RepID=A0A7X0JTX5_9GAMM|nr:BlaI/MecI/CopY family transcriptional regulator [Pseudoteredinibacter isoporae]MBB6522189.1 putative transcriptional regulator [Pseudoteredinibacter isoporae]NHO87723.1 BlaI/MecI/CopY family transcriptional regulator [Pseudoteredinibacter isoporae]NIB23946.1 BlaI/MecI/CopY family transcriptional regulator [Pseudoteredinibacter isoporae]